MALSRKAWIAAGLGARLLMVAFLAMTVLTTANHTRFSYEDNFNKLQSYTYMVAAAVIGMAAGVLQLPVAFYLLCKSKRVATSSSSNAPCPIRLTYKSYFFTFTINLPTVVTVLLASGVGAGFGATDDVLRHVHRVRWDDTRTKDDLIGYYNLATVPVVFLLIRMVLSMAVTVVSARL
ncbi:CASP-like protein 4D1 [Miscanthus floridulus]|uniref:CASP-like protein 4D1 n=1 Tax=Miscanthus floridulus TaxID=154761 RepID=UPI003458B3CC